MKEKTAPSDRRRLMIPFSFWGHLRPSSLLFDHL
jgi:hypothetical protein